MTGAPKVVEIDLTAEERKKYEATKNQHHHSVLSERVRANQHPFANSATIKNSLIDWITTFKKLPRFPATTTEFVTSGALYFIMEEIEPDYFTEFDYSVLNK